jgi:hypothetical protein
MAYGWHIRAASPRRGRTTPAGVLVIRHNAPARWILAGGHLYAYPGLLAEKTGISWQQAVSPPGLDCVPLDIDLHQIPPIRPRAGLRAGMRTSARPTASPRMGPGERLARRPAAAAFFGYLPAERGVRGLPALDLVAG